MIKIYNVQNTIRTIKIKAIQEVENQKRNKAQKIIEALKDATPIDTGNARDGWEFKENKIVNEVDYVKYLNEGSSVQAPSHFIEKTVLSQEGVRPSGIIVVYK